MGFLVLSCGRTTDPGFPADEDGDSSSGGASAESDGGSATGGGDIEGSGGKGGSRAGGGADSGSAAGSGTSDGGDPAEGGNDSDDERVQVYSVEEWENGVPAGLNPASCSFGSGYFSQSECRIVLECPNIELQVVSSCVAQAGNGNGNQGADDGSSDHRCWCVSISGSSDEIIAGDSFSGQGLDPCRATAEVCVLP